MELILSPECEAMVREKVASGRYANISEVIEDALRLLDERDRRQRLRDAIAIGDEQFARGEFTTWTADSMDRLLREADAEERQGLPISADVLP